MTREEAAKLLPIIKAFSEGREIETKTSSGWVSTGSMSFVGSPNDYRIKPSPTYRPFANAEECWEEMLKHQPVGWLKHKVSKARYCIGSFDIENVYVGITQTIYAYNKALDEFIFTDGSPFGVKVEEE